MKLRASSRAKWPVFRYRCFKPATWRHCTAITQNECGEQTAHGQMLPYLKNAWIDTSNRDDMVIVRSPLDARNLTHMSMHSCVLRSF